MSRLSACRSPPPRPNSPKPPSLAVAARGLPSSSWRILAFSDAMCSAHVVLASSLRYVSSRVFQSGSTVTTLLPSSSMLDSHDSHCVRTVRSGNSKVPLTMCVGHGISRNCKTPSMGLALGWHQTREGRRLVHGPLL